MNREVKLLPTEQSILNCSAPLRHFINGLRSFLLPRDTADLEFLLTIEVVEQSGNMETGGNSGKFFLKLLLAFKNVLKYI